MPLKSKNYKFDPTLKKQLSEDLAHQERAWRFEKTVQRSLIAFSVALLTIICLAIWASTLRSRIMIEVYADNNLDARHVALRAIARDPRSGAALPLDDARMQLQFAHGEAQTVSNVGRAQESADTVFDLDQAQCAARPKLLIELNSGTMWDRLSLPLSCHHDKVTTTRPGSRTMPILIRPAEQSIKKPDDNQSATDIAARFPLMNSREGPVSLRFYPESGNLVPVLSNHVDILALCDHRPLAGFSVDISPPGWKLTTDSMGLAEFQLTPGRDHGRLSISPMAGAHDKNAEPESGAQILSPQPFELKAPPSQIKARLRRVLVKPGEIIALDLMSVRGKTLLSVELWQDAALSGLTMLPVEGGQAELKIPAPEKDQVVVAIRLQRNLIGDDGVRDESLAWVDSAPASLAWQHFAQKYLRNCDDEGLRALARLRKVNERQARRLMRMSLSRAAISKNLQKIASNQDLNAASIRQIRQRWQIWLMSLYWLLGLGALALTVVSIVRHNQRLYARLQDFANDDDDDGDPLTSPDKIRRRAWLELSVAVTGIVFGLYIVFLLISKMWWG